MCFWWYQHSISPTAQKVKEFISCVLIYQELTYTNPSLLVPVERDPVYCSLGEQHPEQPTLSLSQVGPLNISTCSCLHLFSIGFRLRWLRVPHWGAIGPCLPTQKVGPNNYTYSCLDILLVLAVLWETGRVEVKELWVELFQAVQNVLLLPVVHCCCTLLYTAATFPNLCWPFPFLNNSVSIS